MSIQLPVTSIVHVARAVCMGLFQDMTATEFMALVHDKHIHAGTKYRIYKPAKCDEFVTMHMDAEGELFIKIVCLKRKLIWTVYLWDIEFGQAESYAFP